MRIKPKNILLWLLLLLPYSGCGYLWHWYSEQLRQMQNATVILISKQDKQLRLIDFRGNELMCKPIAIGLNPGDKQENGDMKTPEGVFSVMDIQNSSNWKHDFGDGKGEITGAYGPYFIRLNTPGHKGIGIHGTHLPASLGMRASEGCIRVSNEDLEKMVSLISYGTMVIITPGDEDLSGAVRLPSSTKQDKK